MENIAASITISLCSIIRRYGNADAQEIDACALKLADAVLRNGHASPSLRKLTCARALFSPEMELHPSEDTEIAGALKELLGEHFSWASPSTVSSICCPLATCFGTEDEASRQWCGSLSLSIYAHIGSARCLFEGINMIDCLLCARDVSESKSRELFFRFLEERNDDDDSQELRKNAARLQDFIVDVIFFHKSQFQARKILSLITTSAIAPASSSSTSNTQDGDSETDAGAEEVEVEAEEAHETTFLRKGASVVYESNKPEIAVIVGVHHDDDETYYTIRLSDGREKQTEKARLRPLVPSVSAGNTGSNSKKKKKKKKVVRGLLYERSQRIDQVGLDLLEALCKKSIDSLKRGDAPSDLNFGMALQTLGRGHQAELLLERFAAELLELTSVGKKFRISALCDCLALLSVDNHSLEDFLKTELKFSMKGDEGESASQVARILASILTKDSALLEDDFELLGAASQLVRSTFSTPSPDWLQIGTVANLLYTMADDGLANSVASDIERCFLLPLPSLSTRKHVNIWCVF